MYRSRVPRTLPDLREPGKTGFAINVSYLDQKNLKFQPLPRRVVERYKEEGGDAINIDLGHAVLVGPGCGRGEPEVEPVCRNPTTPVVPQEDRITPTSVLLAVANKLRRNERLKPVDSELTDIIARLKAILGQCSS